MVFPLRNYASDVRHFGSKQESNTETYVFVQPRPKYTYFAYFEIPDGTAPDWYQEAVKSGKMLAAMMSISHPSVDFESETMRTYNGVRTVPLKIKYKPIQAKFHDDSASLVMNLIKEYRKHYHYSGDATEPTDFGDGLVMSQSPRGGSLPSIGMKSRTTRCFFSKIIIYDLGTSPTHVNIYHLINPTITSIEHDALDYYDTPGIVSVTLGIEYEGYYDEIGVSVKDKPEALIQLGEDPNQAAPDQTGGFSSSDPFSSMVDGSGGLGSFGSGLLGGLVTNLFGGLKNGLTTGGGNPLNTVRDAVRNLAVTAERQAETLLLNKLKDSVDGVDGMIPFGAGNSFGSKIENVATETVRKLMREVTVDGVSWLEKVGS